jgi:6-phosphogluconolactonase
MKTKRVVAGTVTCYHLDRRSGLLTEGEAFASVPPAAGLHPRRPRSPTVPGMPTPAPADLEKAIWAADIHMTPDGRFLYASERTTSTVAAFAIDQHSGRLTTIDSIETETHPRGMRIDPSGRYLLVAGLDSHHLSVYAIDEATGRLSRPRRYEMGRAPNWIEVLRLP